MNDDTAPLLGENASPAGGPSYDAVGGNGGHKTSCCSGGGCGSAAAPTGSPPGGDPCCADGTVSDCCARLALGPDGTTTLTCLAIIRPDNSAVDVFDTRGEVRTFRTLSGLLMLGFDASGRHAAGAPGDAEEAGDGPSRRVRHEARLPVTDSMPAECNSGRIRSHLAERGYSLGHWLHYRRGRRGTAAAAAPGASGGGGAVCRADRSCSLGRGMYAVRHGGHVDYLVHNPATDELHLEYHCGDCGGVDIHGRFEHVNTRSWTEGGPGGTRRVDLHVYEVPTGRPFRLLDVLEGLFELESRRVGAVRRLGPAPPSPGEGTGAGPRGKGPTGRGRVGKSQFHVRQICCASEVPQVSPLLRVSMRAARLPFA